MNSLQVPGVARGTALEFTSVDGELTMASLGPGAGGHSSVVLFPDWVLPLAAWFAGEAQPVSLGDRPGTPYGRTLDVRGDGYTIVWNTHTWARLDCLRPFGSVRVNIGPRGKGYGSSVMISPADRQDVASWLRRADAEGWTQRELTA